MQRLVRKLTAGPGTSAKKERILDFFDIFAAGIINQKAVNQNTQQVLVLIAVQFLNLAEAQFGFATNSDQDVVNE